jgi:tetratricopeptide (TPR) repeat protein
MACLFGLVAEPLELIQAVLTSSRVQAFDLALHAIYTQPLPVEDQFDTLKILLNQLPADQRLPLLRKLSTFKPQMAARLAHWSADELQPLTGFPLQVVLAEQGIDELLGPLDRALACRLTAQPDQEIASLNAAMQGARRLQARLSAQIACAAGQNGDPQAARAAWEVAVELDPEAPAPLAGLVGTLIDAGLPGDAQDRLSNFPKVESSPHLLLLLARMAGQGGETEKARQYAGQAAELFLEPGAEAANREYGKTPEHFETGLVQGSRLHPNQIDFGVNLADLLLDLGLPRLAVQVAAFVLNHQPERAELLALVAQAQGQIGEAGQAVQAAHLAVALEPGRLDFRRILAESLERCGDWKAALVERSTLISRSNASSDPALLATDLRAQANCALHAGELEQSVQASRQAILIDPQDGLAFTLLGDASAALGDPEAAFEQLHRAAELSPGQPEPWLSLARLYNQVGQPQKCLEILQTATRAAPEFPAVHLALGEAFLAQKAPTQALAVLRRAADLAHTQENSSNQAAPGIALRLGQTLHQLGHLPEARQILQGAYRAAPDVQEIAYSYAQILLALGEKRAALAPLESLLLSSPADPAPYIDYASALLSLSAPAKTGREPTHETPDTSAPKVEKAVPALRRALEISPDQAEARALLAEALTACGELLPAMEAYRSALETTLAQDPAWQSRLSLGLGQVALKIGQIETAIAALQEAAQAGPLNPDIQRSLSEAYDAAGLSENAFQAARAAILLAPEDIGILTWFAEQALELRSRPGAPISQTQTEAINALNRAASLAPERSDLLIRLGQVQMQAGETQAARSTLNKLVEQQEQRAASERNIGDLYQASKKLLRLGDAGGAVKSLELALQSNRRRTDWTLAATAAGSPSLLDLLTDLAAARYSAGDPEGALDALDQAIVVAPEEASLYLDKADLHLEMSQPTAAIRPESSSGDGSTEQESTSGTDHIQAALACLETALKLNPGDPSLHQRAALIQRATGDLSAALAHAEQAAGLQPVPTNAGPEGKAPNSGDRAACALAADLAYTQFQNTKARRYLSEDWPASLPFDPFDRIDYYCLRAELALEAGDNLYAADDLSNVLDFASEHPRVLAIQSRLVARRGDLEVALQMLRDAEEALSPADKPLRSKNGRQKEQHRSRKGVSPDQTRCGIRGIGLLSARMRNLNNQLSVAEAALELHRWEVGLELLKQVTAAAPLELLYQLRFARALVLRAEFHSLCRDLQVIRHAPSETALSAESRQSFESAIQAAEAQASREHGNGAECSVDLLQSLRRWKARGQAVFDPNRENASALGTLGSDPEDVAARVACLRQIGDTAAAGQAARAYPQYPRVLIQLALALFAEKPRQALAAAHAATEIVLRPEMVLRPDQPGGAIQGGGGESPHKAPSAHREDTPLVHALLARLVHQSGNRAGDSSLAVRAIEAALVYWPDEPRWHALAAEIYATRSGPPELSDLAPVIHHLEQAIQLEPKYGAHYLALGRVTLQEGDYPRAIQALEQATRLSPELPEPWLLQAQAFRAAGDLEQAASRAERAVTLAPESVAPLLLRGEIALETDSPRGALSRAQAALRIDSNNDAAQLLLARSLGSLDRPDEALSTLDKALPMTRNPLPFQIERARLLLRSKGQEAALQALIELANTYPGDPTVLSLLAESLAEAGQREAAIQTAQRALRAGEEPQVGQAVSEHANLHLLLGRLLHRAGQLDQAIHHLSEASQHNPTLVEPYLELGHTHQERRQFAQALSAYQQAARIAPGDARGFYYSGLVFKESKDYLSAESMLRKAAALAPDDLSIHRLLAAVVALNLVHNRREPVREG